MGTIGEMSLRDAAREVASSWKRFSCFCWDRLREIDDPDNWAIVYTHNGDSGFLAQSNPAIIADAIKPFSEIENADAILALSYVRCAGQGK
jgi:hypothetical protein